jgi:putative salt-induced outer membrane protein YdiY
VLPKLPIAATIGSFSCGICRRGGLMAIFTSLQLERAAMRFVRQWVLSIALVLCARIASAQSPLLAPPVTSPTSAPATSALPASPTTPTPSASITAPPTSATPTPAVPPAAATTPSATPKSDPVLSKFLTEPLPVPKSADAAKSADDKGDGLPPEEPSWYERAFLLVPAPWDKGIELGINGSAGTSDSFSMRAGGYMKQESRFSKLDMSLYYNRTDSSGKITQNNAQFDIRNDWLLDDKSPWTLFGQNSEFYDEFKDFNVQTNLDTGLGYRFFHDKTLELIGRMGGGTSREFGGADERWVPEGLFGVEYSQQVFRTQKVYAKVDYFPEIDQASSYRVVADTGWEVVLVQPSNLSLKICATDRYDSTPSGGAEPHLINYSVMMIMKL